ncbi:hypothetical protein BDQ12DRAFT_722695 [Crucibulum laeve]|uniref:Uncharacterized protein n=1 Tax=Crucibulum laeve TaxID=68775 RepID=A0A5C3M2F9_9AGAR|nr:hypothetical protein BDQ12DRAFT_722695 [Crucibulum laeve]
MGGRKKIHTDEESDKEDDLPSPNLTSFRLFFILPVNVEVEAAFDAHKIGEDEVVIAFSAGADFSLAEPVFFGLVEVVFAGAGAVFTGFEIGFAGGWSDIHRY